MIQIYLSNIRTQKIELENIFKLEAEGAAVRARAKYAMDGERPTRLFCNLEKYNGTQKFIPQIIKEVNDQEVCITDQDQIETEIRDYYRTLFANHDHVITVGSPADYLGPTADSFPKLSDREASTTKGKLTVEEMGRFLKKTRNNVSPGNSGFTGDFYKFFWADIKHFVVNSANYSFEIGTLSIQQRLGIITLLPKGVKRQKISEKLETIDSFEHFFKTDQWLYF